MELTELSKCEKLLAKRSIKSESGRICAQMYIAASKTRIGDAPYPRTDVILPFEYKHVQFDSM